MVVRIPTVSIDCRRSTDCRVKDINRIRRYMIIRSVLLKSVSRRPFRVRTRVGPGALHPFRKWLG